jgi:hypothetical protein
VLRGCQPDLCGFPGNVARDTLVEGLENSGDCDQLRLKTLGENARVLKPIRPGNRPAGKRPPTDDMTCGDHLAAGVDSGEKNHVPVGMVDLLPGADGPVDDE